MMKSSPRVRSVRQTHAEASADLGCLRAFQKKRKKASCADTAEENFNKREGGNHHGLAVLRARLEKLYGP